MRFAYIDSNGNEVPIPSVDALALRIELGAISEETQLYDAQADQWGPAHTHEIYHTLARDSESDDGFVAPPPVAPPPAAPAEQEGTATEAEGEPAEAPAAKEPPAEPEPAEPEPAELEAGSPGADPADMGLTLADAPEGTSGAEAPADDPAPSDVAGLTLADPVPTADDDGPATGSAADVPDDVEGMDLAPMLEESEEAPDTTPIDLGDPLDDGAPGSGAADQTGSFDFGGLDGGLQLEETFEAPEDPDAMDFGDGAAGPMAGGFDDGMELETAMDFGAGGFEMDDGGALDLETPMSEFSPDDPPSWMDGDAEATGDGEVLDFSSVGGDSEEEVPLRDRRTPKNRPSRPRRRRPSLTGPLIGAVVIVAIGVGVYAAWPAVSARLTAGQDQEDPGVYIPPLSAELMPQMREAAEAALAATFEDVRQEWSGTGVAVPPSDWLAGIYLANASDYGGAEVFWNGIGDLLEGVRGIGLAEFDAAMASELARRGVSSEDAEAMRARADSGFVAAVDAREETYAGLDRLVTAALRLHQFLIANEANIEYVPASTVTTDPVLEVNPASPEIGDAMGDLIDSVTGGLAALGYRDQVSADGLWRAVLGRVQDTGIQ